MFELWQSFMNSFGAPQGTGTAAGTASAQSAAGLTDRGAVPGASAASGAPNWWGGVDQAGNISNGVIPGVAQAGSALAQSWLGFQNYGLAKDQLSFQKDAFNKNFSMQQDAYNTAQTNQTNTAAAQNS